MGAQDRKTRCNPAISTTAISKTGGSERRGTLRYRTVLRWARVSGTDDVGLWRVRNISRGGMMLATGRRPIRGAMLLVELSEAIALHGEVVWSNAEACGVALEKPIGCDSMLRALFAEQNAKDYRPLRLPTSTTALLHADGGIYPIQLTNLSYRGVGFTSSHDLPPGTGIRIVTEAGTERRGLIRWSGDGHAGALLTEPFTFEQLESAKRI